MSDKSFYSLYYLGYPVFESFRFEQMKKYQPETCKVIGNNFEIEISFKDFKLDEKAFVYYRITEEQDGIREKIITKSNGVTFEFFTSLEGKEKMELFQRSLDFYAVPNFHLVPTNVDKRKYILHLMDAIKHDHRIEYDNSQGVFSLKEDPNQKVRFVADQNYANFYLSTGIFNSDYKKANKKEFFEMQKKVNEKDKLVSTIKEIIEKQRLFLLFM